MENNKEVMLNKEFIKQIADITNLPMYIVRKVIREGLIKVLAQNLKNGKSITISGLGQFYPKIRKGSRGINFKTKKVMNISSTKSIGFKIGKQLKSYIRSEGNNI